VTKFCPTCNRSSADTKFVGEFCEVCTAERIKKKLPSHIKLSYCKRCNRIKAQHVMTELTDRATGAAISRELFNSKCEVEVKSFENGIAELGVYGYKIDGSSVDFQMELSIDMQHNICQDCYRKSSGYYEAIVQLRGEDEKVNKFFERLDRYAISKGAFIGKVDKKDNGGLDLYVSDKKLVNVFLIRTKVKTKRSYTLYSVKKGERVFRNTYFVEL
jgi:NMD protein affecting ribosome stability and mRNA decay